MYLLLREKLTITTKNLDKISKRTLKHVKEDRRKLPLSNIKVILNLDNTFDNVYNQILNIFEEKDYKKIEEVLLKIIQSNEEIQEEISFYKDSMEQKNKYSVLHLDILFLSSEILISLKELLENFYSINTSS